MKKLLTIILVLLSFTGFSQTVSRSVLASGGSVYSGSSYIVTSTIGEPVIGTATQGSYTVTQGFEQGYFTAPDKINDITVNYRMYPNPVQNILYLELSADKAPNLNMSIFDVNGHCVISNEINFAGNSAKISQDVSNFAIGTYLIKIQDNEGKVLQTLKFIKK